MKDDITWANIKKLYMENYSGIDEIVIHINSLYKIPKKIIRDQIKKELIVFTEQTHKSNLLFDLLKYYASLFIALFSGIIFFLFKKKKIKSDVLYEELWQERSLYSRFYIYIDNLLSKKISSSILLNFPTYSNNVDITKIEGVDKKKIFDIRKYNILFHPSISFKFFIYDFFYSFKLIFIKSKNLNLLLLYLKLIRKILIYKTQSSQMNTKVLISASDYYWGPFKYYFFKYHGVKNIFLIQHNFVGDYITNNFYLSCDYYFAHSQLAINKKIGFYNKRQFPIGSVQLSPFLDATEPSTFDILMIDQPVHELVMVVSRGEGDKEDIIKQYNILLYNIKKYLLHNKTKKMLYVLKSGAMKKDTFIHIKNIFKDIENITFVEAYGKKTFRYINQSELIINMYSSVGIESYGLNKKVLWINYNNCCDIFKFDTEKESLHIVISDDSCKAFEDRVNLLLSDNKEIDEHYQKLKVKYMNIQENPAKIIADKINEILEKE